MSFINHLEKRAKAQINMEAPRPKLVVPGNKVGAVTEHILACEGDAYRNREAVRKALIAGQFALHGSMLRVVGHVEAQTPAATATFPRRQPTPQGQEGIHRELCPLSDVSTGPK